MAIPKTVEDQAQQAKEAWEEHYGTPSGEAADEHVESKEEPKEPTKEEKVDPEDYKERFRRYKASADSTIHDLRTQLAAEAETNKQLQERMQHLEEQMASTQPQGQEWKAELSEEDLETLDEETLNTVAKVAGASVAGKLSTQEQRIQALEQAFQAQREAQAQSQKAQTHQEFVSRLETAVPDVREIDETPEFGKWLEGVDDLSGRTRRELAMRAMQDFDVGRVAQIYNDWKATQGAADPRESKIAPSRAADAGPAPEGKVWSRDEIAKFYEDRRRGKIQDDEAKRLERDIFAAQAQGRIR